MSELIKPDFCLFKQKKNLLAFSAGIDSTALFFLLLEQSIDFDIAIVNYNSRNSSQEEVAYAQKLAKKYTKRCHILDSKIEIKHMEEKARNVRYDFFDELVDKYHYETLLTAHQLNDQLEWFLMQLTKGAGTLELLGMQTSSVRKNYILLKPLLSYSKEELLDYLIKNNHNYYLDESNQDESYKRNYFRHNFSNALIKEYKEGIKRSFTYLEEDAQSLLENTKKRHYKDMCVIFASTQRARLFHIDKHLKKSGYILSQGQRDEIKTTESLVISDKFCISNQDKLSFIVPVRKATMDKAFKELCRIHKVPVKIRPYLYQEDKELKHYLRCVEELLL